MKKIYLMKVEQPIGYFYLGKLNSEELRKIAEPNRRKLNEGIQRRLRGERLRDISFYCDDPDATFPTPIILAVEENCELKELENGLYEYKIDLESNVAKAEILDGQHRLFGILDSGKNIELPIVLMFNLTEEEKAYVFSTINSNQQKVDKSLIYDLFELSKTRSPYKTCHELARLFNSKIESPFCGRLKMLESRDSSFESLSQGTFVRYVVKLISDNPQRDYIDIKNNVKLKNDKPGCPLRYYFVTNQDEIIYLILSNCFTGLKNAFPEEWNKPQKYILSKTTGFGAVIKFLKAQLADIFTNGGDLTVSFFEKVFSIFKDELIKRGLELTSNNFSPSEQNEKKLSDIIVDAYLTAIK